MSTIAELDFVTPDYRELSPKASRRANELSERTDTGDKQKMYLRGVNLGIGLRETLTIERQPEVGKTFRNAALWHIDVLVTANQLASYTNVARTETGSGKLLVKDKATTLLNYENPIFGNPHSSGWEEQCLLSALHKRFGQDWPLMAGEGKDGEIKEYVEFFDFATTQQPEGHYLIGRTKNTLHHSVPRIATDPEKRLFDISFSTC